MCDKRPGRPVTPTFDGGRFLLQNLPRAEHFHGDDAESFLVGHGERLALEDPLCVVAVDSAEGHEHRGERIALQHFVEDLRIRCGGESDEADFGGLLCFFHHLHDSVGAEDEFDVGVVDDVVDLEVDSFLKADWISAGRSPVCETPCIPPRAAALVECFPGPPVQRARMLDQQAFHQQTREAEEGSLLLLLVALDPLQCSDLEQLQVQLPRS